MVLGACKVDARNDANKNITPESSKKKEESSSVTKKVGTQGDDSQSQTKLSSHESTSVTDVVSASSDETSSSQTSSISVMTEETASSTANSGSATASTEPANGCGSKLRIVVRDFSQSHPDFQGPSGAKTGLVEPTLDMDGKPRATNMGVASGLISSKDSFSQWYRNVMGINYRFERTIDLEVLDEAKQIFHYKNAEFFPIGNSEGFGADILNGKKLSKNFWFTTEVHLNFVYQRDQSFKFSGDDDLWIFINGDLALDLGGVHSEMSGMIDLNVVGDQFNLKPGELYPMSIFHAERHTSKSNFEITAAIGCIFVPG